MFFCMQVSDKDIRDMMKEVGVEIKGRIYYEDFVRMMTGKIGRAHRRVCHIAVSYPLPFGHIETVLLWLSIRRALLSWLAWALAL